MNINRKPPRIRRLLLLAFVSAAYVGAQDDSQDDDEVFQLSPFTVDGSGEMGYTATSTLAGTRINTKLSDLANSITVVTKELMEDLQVTEATTMLPFVGNLETAGADGTFGGVGTGGETIEYRGINRNPDNRNRVRGLARADSTRNYVPTNIKFDSYNTERVTVNRGPNSTLFGLGSPGGIVDNTTISPRMANRNKVQFTYGSFGAYRATVDIDRVLIEDRLGIRVAGLHRRHAWRQNHTFEDDDRLTVALRYKPTKNTNIKFSQEFGSIEARRPRFSGPTDGFTRWFEAPWADPTHPSGKITHNPSLGLGFRDSNRDLLRAPGSWFFQPGAVYENNGGPLRPLDIHNAWERETPNGNNAPDGSRLDFRSFSITQFRQWSSSGTFAAVTGRTDGGFFGVDALPDRTVVDWAENIITGPNHGQKEAFEVGALSLDHGWDFPLGKFGVELMASHEELERGFYDAFNGNRGYQLSIDLNTTLNTGAENPNFGRPFVAGETTREQSNRSRDVQRATVFYEIDFKRGDHKLGWLFGRHVGTLFGQDFSNYTRNYFSRNLIDPASLLTMSNATSLTSGAARLQNAIYVGSSFANDSAPVGGQGVITPVQSPLDLDGTFTGTYFDEATLSWVTTPVTPINVLTNDENFYNYITGDSFNRVDTGSHAYIHQTYLFGQEWLIGTYGYRTDKVVSYGSDIADFTDPSTGELRTNGRFSNNIVNWRTRQLNESPIGEPFQQPTESLGFVMHVPEFVPLPEGVNVSFHWQDAENFQIGSTRMNILGDIITPPTGTTKEQGITIGLWNDKFVLKFNEYETLSRGYFSPDGDLYQIDRRVVRENTPEALAAAGWQGPPQFYQDLVNWRVVEDPGTNSGYNVETDPTDLPISDTQSTLSEGIELDLIYNPSNRWRIAANLSQQEARRSNIGPGAIVYFNARVDEWTSTGPTGDLQLDTSGQELRLRVVDVVTNSMNILFAREGQLADEIREWRLNLVTNYNFAPDSKFKGWNIGGAFRWEDERAAGYPIITQTQDGGEIQVPDLANPYMDDAVENLNLWIGYETKIRNDTMDWKLQLNLNNVLNSGEIRTTAFQPDGTFRSGVWREGRTFQLRSSFEF